MSQATIDMLEALRDEDIETARRCLAEGADPNAQDDGGTYALSWAVSARDLDFVNELLRAGARPNAPPPYDLEHVDDPFEGAVMTAETRIVEALIRHGARALSFTHHISRSTTLHSAVAFGVIANVRLAMSVGGEQFVNHFDDLGQTPLIIAVDRGDMDLAKLLVEAGSDVNIREELTDCQSPLGVACEWLDERMVKFLLDHGANPALPECWGVSLIERLRDDSREGRRAEL